MADELAFKNELTVAKYSLDLGNCRIGLVDGSIQVRVLVRGHSMDGRELAGRFLHLDLSVQEEQDIRAAFQPAIQRLKDALGGLDLTEHIGMEE